MSDNLEFIERIKAEKNRSHLTTAQLSEISKVPKGTLEKLLSGETANPFFTTVRDVCIALKLSLDDVAGIPSPHENDEEDLRDEMKAMYERMVDEKTETIRSQTIVISDMNQLLREQYIHAAEERDRLRSRYMRIIMLLGIALASVLAIVSVILIYDLTNPALGYFQY